MGTHSLVFFERVGEDGLTEVYAVIYQQFDGYPSGVGLQLAKFLDSVKMTNGIDMSNPTGIANGVGCLAAQYIAKMKTKAGGLYMSSSTKNDQEYNYHVRSHCPAEEADWNTPDEIRVILRDEDNEERGEASEMSVQEFLNFCQEN